MDLDLNPDFVAVAADLGFVPGDHYSLAECQTYTEKRRRPRDERGRFIPRGANQR
ncbi:MAG TPA: hypothetical protein VIP28_10985 [Nocardioides sp.]